MIPKKHLKLSSIIFGVILIIIGASFNSIASDIGRNEQTIILEPGDQSINVFTFKLNPNQYGLNIQLYGSFYSTSDTSILFINQTEYQEFLGGEDISNLTAFLELNGTYNPSTNRLDFQKTFSLQKPSSFAIIVVNDESSTINGYYSFLYSIIAPFYFYGLVLIFIGCLVALSVAAWHFIGWKRYFMIGAEISTITFLVRVGIFPILPANLNFLSLFNFFDIEIYRDFEYYYCLWGELFRDGNMIFSGVYGGYSYGPLFMLILGLFSLIPIPLWSMAIPILLSTIGTGYLVFKISYKITSNTKYGIYAMLLFFLNPFTLLYSSFGWLNPSLFVFFIVLSFYFILEHKYGWAIVSLAISTMTKQFAVIFVPIVLLLMIKMERDSKILTKIRNFLLYAVGYIGIIFLISLPFLLLNFNIFIQKFILGGADINLDYLTTFNNFPGAMVHFNTFFLMIGTPEIITNFIAVLLKYYILLGGCLLGINLYLLLYSPKKSKDSCERDLFVLSLFLSILTILSFQLFYPRGSFKYYLILLVPFISILFGANIEAETEEAFSFKYIYVFPTIISWSIFFFNRYLYFWIIIAWMIQYIIFLYLASRRYNTIPNL